MTTLAEDGSRVYEVRMVPAAKGEALAILRDVTARKKADVAIAKLAAFPLNNPNPLLELSEQGEVLFANQTARDLAGRAGPGQVRGHPAPAEYPQLCRECLASGTVARRPSGEKAGRPFPAVDVHAHLREPHGSCLWLHPARGFCNPGLGVTAPSTKPIHPVIVWFRRDLRLARSSGLQAACRGGHP